MKRPKPEREMVGDFAPVSEARSEAVLAHGLLRLKVYRDQRPNPATAWRVSIEARRKRPGDKVWRVVRLLELAGADREREAQMVALGAAMSLADGIVDSVREFGKIEVAKAKRERPSEGGKGGAE